LSLYNKSIDAFGCIYILCCFKFGKRYYIATRKFVEKNTQLKDGYI